jgi:hypothetical protein
MRTPAPFTSFVHRSRLPCQAQYTVARRRCSSFPTPGRAEIVGAGRAVSLWVSQGAGVGAPWRERETA